MSAGPRLVINPGGSLHGQVVGDVEVMLAYDPITRRPGGFTGHVVAVGARRFRVWHRDEDSTSPALLTESLAALIDAHPDVVAQVEGEPVTPPPWVLAGAPS